MYSKSDLISCDHIKGTVKISFEAIESFVQAWEVSTSIDDAMQKLGWTGTRGSLIAVAAGLRRKGVPLKRFKGRRPDTLQSKAARAQFISVWQTSRSISEVAERLGLLYDSVMQKADCLRKEGIYLKRHRRQRIFRG